MIFFILDEDDTNIVDDRHQELEDMFFGMKDIDPDDRSDQTIAHSINNIGVMVLGNNEEFQDKNSSRNTVKIKPRSER